MTGRAARGALVVLASLVLGGLTSTAQGVLPDAWSSFANSASGWTLLTVLLVLWSRLPAAPAAMTGATSFVALVLGYTIASELRGLAYSPLLFGTVGVLVGPFVGVAATWLRERDLRAALATALLAGIGIGEAWYGLTVVADTTSPVYWTTIGVVGGALLAGMLVRRIRGPVAVAVAVIGTAAVAGAFVLAYSALGGG